MQRVLVTGAAGFAGRYLLEELSAGGIRAVGTYYRTPRPRNLRLRIDEWLHCDVRDARAVDEVVATAKPDGIVHLAAMSVPVQANTDPRAAYDTNVRGWLNVLEAVRQAGRSCRLLLISSSHVYGHAPPGSTGFHEDFTVQPYDVYGSTRATGEMIAKVYGKQHGLEIITARAFNHCGPRQSPHYFVATLTHQITQAVLGLDSREVRVGNLDVVRDFTDVRDVARAYVSLLLRGQVGEVYNVCSGKPVSLQTVVNLMQEICGHGFRMVSDQAKTAGGQPSTVFGDPRRLQQTTGWTQTIPLIDTLRDTFHYWRERLESAVETPARTAAEVSA